MSACYRLFIVLVKLIYFSPPKPLVLKEGLHGGAPAAHFSLISAFMVIVIQPCVEINLQLL